MRKPEAIAREYLELAAERDRLKAEANAIWAKMEAIIWQEIPATLDELGISPCTVPGVARLGVQDEVSCSIRDPKPVGYDWLRANGHGDLIQATVNAGTLKSWARQRILAGDDMPEDVFKYAVITKGTVTRV